MYKNNFSKIQEVNFSNLKKEMPMNGQEAYQTPKSMGKKINSPEHIIIKHQLFRKRTLKEAKEKDQVI